MRKKIFWLISVLSTYACCSFAQLTTPSPSNIATDSDKNFYLYAQKQWNKYILPHQNDTAYMHETTERYQAWYRFWSNRVCIDTPSTTSMFGTISQLFDIHVRNAWDCTTQGGNWTCVGPFRSFYGQSSDMQGRMHAMWIDPANQNNILAASAMGGLYQTKDGGQNWTNITDLAGFALPGTLGIDMLAVDPLNHNNIYISTGSYGSTDDWKGRYGLGLMYSNDGGITWQIDNSYRTVIGTVSTDGWSRNEVWKLAYQPGSEKLFALTSTQVLYKANPTSNWVDITPSGLPADYTFSSFDFTHSPTGKVVVCTTGGTLSPSDLTATEYLFWYNESSLSWTNQSLIIPFRASGIQDVGLAANDKIYLLTDNHLATCGSTGSSVTILSNSILSGVTHALVVSQTSPNTVYVLNNCGNPGFAYETTNAGQSWTTIGFTHADCRDFKIYSSGSNLNGTDDVIFACTDGGVAKKDAGTMSFHSITGNGLVVTEFNSVSSLPENDGIMLGGATDNGIQSYSRNNAAQWGSPQWGDGLMVKFSKNNTGVAYTEWQGGTNASGQSVSGLNPNRLKYNTSTNDMEIDAAIGQPAQGTDEDYSQVHSARRMLNFDKNNLATVGIHWLWQEPLNTSTWHPMFGSKANQPKPGVDLINNTGYLGQNKTIVDYFVSEKNPDIAYIAYNSIEYDQSYFTNVLTGNLFSTTTATQASPTWTMVDPPLLNTPISSIAVDQQNPNRIWVSYGDVNSADIGVLSSNRHNRVFHSENYGQTWSDVSIGLSAMPISKLLYVEGSDDVIFAGTDVGVYRWNKTAKEWDCFSDEMPRAIISDLEMNYCNGKLRAATYGRGIWESDYNPENPNAQPPVLTTITANTTLNASQTFNGSIMVTNGATLTISGVNTTIFMPKLGVITVDKGSKLIVDGATITNGCSGALWYGIEVAGDNTQPEDAPIQGYLELKNGATLSHANCAILNYDLPSYRCGGVIVVNDSHIDNCVKALSLNNTPNYSYQVSTGSLCLFNNTTFNKDDETIPSDADGYFSGWNILGGVLVENCTFDYSAPWQDVSYSVRNQAVKVSDVGLTVENCNFDGWCKGVYSADFTGTPNRVVNVAGNKFNHTSECVTMGGSAYGNIIDNAITNMYAYVSLDDNTLRDPVGIYLNSTHGTYVGCGNVVDGTTDGGPFPTTERHGLATFYTSPFLTYVIGNQFNNLTVGLQPQMDNPYLQVSCNTFNGDDFGMAVNPQSPNTNTFMDQGTGCGPGENNAGNLFIGNQTDIASYNVNNWKYYAGNGPNEVPTNWTGGVDLNNCNQDINSLCTSDYSHCVVRADQGRFNLEVSQYNGFSTGQKYSLDGQLQYGDIIRGFNYYNDMNGLQTFLEAQGDEISTRLLIPLYIDRQLYTKATGMIRNLTTLSSDEIQGYNDYYNLLITLKQTPGQPVPLEGDQLDLVNRLAASSLEVSPLARGLLEFRNGVKWQHPLEQVPSSDMMGRAAKPGTATQKSYLTNASPNPAQSNTTIGAFVAAIDANKKPVLYIRNASGKEYFSQKLEMGQNNIPVNTAKYPAGIYFYSLETAKVIIETKKLSITN